MKPESEEIEMQIQVLGRMNKCNGKKSCDCVVAEMQLAKFHKVTLRVMSLSYLKNRN
jgi:hypothetical protein